jgi:hypothetical protein
MDCPAFVFCSLIKYKTMTKMKELMGAKRLTKLEQKKITGGDGNGTGNCTMTYQDASGEWHTESGKCQLAYVGQGIGGSGIYQPYCKTDSFPGPVPLSSNGGVSKCGSHTTLLGMLFS